MGGRADSLPDLVGSMQELRGAKVDLFIHQQGLDTTTPAGRAMFGMLGVFSEFERAMIVARVSAVLARAKVHGTKSGRKVRLTIQTRYGGWSCTADLQTSLEDMLR